jgi:hypothetical protein
MFQVLDKFPSRYRHIEKTTREDIKAKYKVGKEKPVSPKQKTGNGPAL